MLQRVAANRAPLVRNEEDVRPGADTLVLIPTVANHFNNPADGSLIVAAPGNWHDGECASPIVEGSDCFVISRCGFSALNLPKAIGDKPVAPATAFELKPAALKPPDAPNPYYPYPVSSPVSADGIIWFTHSGSAPEYYHEKNAVLFAVDTATGKPLYRQELDMLKPWCSYNTFGGGLAASLTVAGKYLYVMDNMGNTLVAETGKTFKQVAVNSIRCKPSRWGCPQEFTISTPIFEGERVYYRAYDNLYCIGEK